MVRETITLGGRDLTIVQMVARFKQLTARHIHQLVCADRSMTPVDRALKRLTTAKYLHRIERRTVGGAHGGSGQYVYALGRRGHFMMNEGRFDPARAVNYHALAIADTFLMMSSREVIAYSTEPDCHVTIAGIQLKPDLFMELRQATGVTLKLWFEVDMGTEGQQRLKAKLEAYWRAYNDCDWPVFPRTVWVAVDEERAREIKWLIEQGPKDAQTLFSVATIPSLAVPS